MQPGLDILRAAGFQVEERPALGPSELQSVLGTFDAVTVRVGTRIDAAALDAAPALRVVGRPGSGYDNVDLEAATRRGVVVMNSPEGNRIPTSELTLGLLLALARNVASADAALKAGRWDRKAFGGVQLAGRRLGIVGLGRIGSAVAQRARAFDMDVVACDPYVAPSTAASLGVPLIPLDELLSTADFVTLHTTLTPETRGLIGAAALARTRPGVRLVNASRGEVVDDRALLAALDSGHVAGAALDVHTTEPPVDWRLVQHPRVVATPHVGGQTPEALARVGTDIARQLRDFLLHGTLQHVVNPGVVPRAR